MTFIAGSQAKVPLAPFQVRVFEVCPPFQLALWETQRFRRAPILEGRTAARGPSTSCRLLHLRNRKLARWACLAHPSQPHLPQMRWQCSQWSRRILLLVFRSSNGFGQTGGRDESLLSPQPHSTITRSTAAWMSQSWRCKGLVGWPPYDDWSV